jgi:hypothetical protein
MCNVSKRFPFIAETLCFGSESMGDFKPAALTLTDGENRRVLQLPETKVPTYRYITSSPERLWHHT